MKGNGNPLLVDTYASSFSRCLHRTGGKNTTTEIIFKNLIDLSVFASIRYIKNITTCSPSYNFHSLIAGLNQYYEDRTNP
jgi:hypothetical protein